MDTLALQKMDSFFKRGIFAPVCEHQQANPNQRGDTAIDRPLELTRHHAAGQDVDPLQKPACAHQDQQDGDDIQENFHFNILLVRAESMDLKILWQCQRDQRQGNRSQQRLDVHLACLTAYLVKFGCIFDLFDFIR
jgi:hypothetical protein